MSQTPEHSKILIVLPRQLGDILLGSSLAFALKSRFPQARICWLSHPMGKQLLDGHPALQEVIYHPVYKAKSLSTWMKNPIACLVDLLAAARTEITFLLRLRRMNFDFVIDSICTPKTAIMSFSTGATRRHGIKTRWNRNWAYTWLCDSKDFRDRYAASARLNLLKPVLDDALIGNPPAHWLTSWIPCPPSSESRVASIMNELNLVQNQFVVLSPTSRRALRRWPAHSYEELAVRLVTEDNMKVCWFWGPGEFDDVSGIHERVQMTLKGRGASTDSSCLPPLLSLSEAAHMSGRAWVWVGNTNGLSHVAVAGGARTVQIYGPTAPSSWIHPDTSKHKAVQRAEGCVSCQSNVCRTGTHECMQELSVETVLDAIRALRTASAN